MAFQDTRVQWLGHATFRITTPGGKEVLIDPFLEQNPSCPTELKRPQRLDLILVTHAHQDHVGDAVATAQRTGAEVVAVVEAAAWLERQGVERVVGMNKGGSYRTQGLVVTMVHADHSTGIAQPDGTLAYGGESAGYILEMENGTRIYHTGDTAVFGDMRLIGELYRPDLVMLPVGDFYTMGPREAAMALRLIGAPLAIPMHFGTFPALTGTPAELRAKTADLAGLTIIPLKPGETYP